jgi:ribosomal protein S28E/S33
VDRLGQRVQAILAADELPVERKLPGDRKVRRIDVRPFLESIQTGREEVRVTCRVTAAGTVRIEEVLQLLELQREDMAAPIRRAAVEWVSTPPQGETK